MTFQNKRSLKVRQEGNTLVAAFQTANPPLIWKFDLERNHSFSLALQGEDGDWELGVVSPKEEFHPVARFLSREDAEEAFTKTQKALLSKKYNIWRTVALTSMTVIVLMVIGVTWAVSFVRHENSTKLSMAAEDEFSSGGLPSLSSMRMAAPPQLPPPPLPVKNGVPMDADQVLRQ